MPIARTLIAALSVILSTTAMAADPQVELKTSAGTIVVELYPDKAPKTVENFLQYAKDGFYDGTIFHRVIAGLHDPGRRLQRRFQGEEDPARRSATRRKRPEEHRRHDRDGAHVGSAFRDGAVLHQRDRQRHARFQVPHRAGLRLLRVRQGGEGHGCRRAHRKVATGPGPAPHRDVPVKPVVIESARVLDAGAKPDAAPKGKK